MVQWLSIQALSLRIKLQELSKTALSLLIRNNFHSDNVYLALFVTGSGFENICLWIPTTSQMTWADAESVCQQQGGHLFSFANAEEFEFMKSVHAEFHPTGSLLPQA